MSPAEGTPLLDYAMVEITSAAAEETLAQNWGWILAAGCVSVMGGVAALSSPIMATEVVLVLISCTLLVIGLITMITAPCFGEPGLQAPSFALGCIQVISAILMQHYPFETLSFLTIMIAIAFMLEGFYRVGLAHKNRDMPGRTMCLLNGLCAIAFSALVVGAFPSSSLYTIGILVGVNLLTSGTARVSIAFLGRSLARSRITSNDAGQPLV